ncbi:MCE family protein [Rhodococcus sp. NPDC059968]|uniref:MCE family protein n=1 Tax=Rhodococcus sp. NPDC059968 TaxID=3347017 RepID=UPI00366B37FB
MIAKHAGTKLLVFIVVTSMVTLGLATLIGNVRFGASRTYGAFFEDASGLKAGEDVKIAGVPVGKVKSIALQEGGQALVRFTVSSESSVSAEAGVAIKYKNLIGDRYLEVDNGKMPSIPRGEDDPVPAAQTTPALDLDALVNGFRPLLQGLNPEETNELSASLVQVLNGQEQSVGALVRHIGTLSNALADRDHAIGSVVTNLNATLSTVNSRGEQFGTAIDQLQQLVSGLSADSERIAASIERIDEGSRTAADLLAASRVSLKEDIMQLDLLATNLNSRTDTLNLVLAKLPEIYRMVGRSTSYGSFLNFFVCGLAIKFPAPGGSEATPMFTAAAERCR